MFGLQEISLNGLQSAANIWQYENIKGDRGLKCQWGVAVISRETRQTTQQGANK